MTDRSGGWAGRAVCVAGLGVSGVAAAKVLAGLGARVTVIDGRDDAAGRGRAAELTADPAGGAIDVRLGADAAPPAGTDLVVTSPGWRPTAPPLVAAAAAGIEVIGEVELAWRLRRPAAPGRPPAPWLAITGTNGKTTAVRMLGHILAAAGLRVRVVGNVGEPIVSAVRGDHDVLAVELSSFQLHWSSSLVPHAATVLNLAPDHLDWHGDLDAYAAAKGRVFGEGTVAVANADDPWSLRLAEESSAAGRRVSFTLGPPAAGQLGVADGTLTDRAFGGDGGDPGPGGGQGSRGASAPGGEPGAVPVRLADVADVRPPAPHNIANALAAAALARAYGVDPGAVRAGLRAFVPDPHRVAEVEVIDAVTYIDDSKATNPHAAAAALRAFPSVVWIAGGLLKGADVGDLVQGGGDRLRGVVLLGRDRAAIAQALARHAPNVPVVEVVEDDTGAMDRVVAEAARLARPGDTVLLAPAGASFDMFAGYGARGDAFAAAVRRLAQGANTSPRTGADRATGPDRPDRPGGPADPTRPG